MNRILIAVLCCCLPAAAQEMKIAVAGLLHSHVWGHIDKMIRGQPAKLVGITETVPELVAEAKKRGAADSLFFPDLKTMLDKTKPDIVWSFVENNRHLEIVEACAPRKIHVMFEKPLASRYRDALAIRGLARKHGIVVLTNYQMAWWPTQYAAKAQADAGAAGKIYRIRGVVGHGGPGSSGTGRYFFDWLTDPEKNGGGALMDFGCYNALWSLWYLGQPGSVYATVNHLRPDVFPKVEDNATMVLSYSNGVALLEGSWDLPRSFQDLEIFGREGSLTVTREAVELRKGRAASPQRIAAPELPPEQAEPIAHMIHAIRAKQPLNPMVALDINLGVVEIIEAARMSVASGQAVKLPLPAK